MDSVAIAFGIQAALMWLIWLVALGMTVFALVHAVRQRQDAFTATGKLSKPAWLAILAGSLLLLLLAAGSFGLLAFIAVVASGVYLADVRPKVDEIQRGGSGW
ncbi:DUF2516 family protein [Nocardia camponoti]|uniref:Membrane protein n=1 Tax=Nocardia camponoti TaxID=1616106 RepID=A0A917V8R6_9NOCA|nr:DUF2516 family protein [Nocardia camponoti]GGK50977.1 membrane protein [Nocardia camponoti]